MPDELRPARSRPPGNPGSLHPVLQRTVELYASGMTVHEVGAATGVAGTTVSRRLRAAGVKAPKPGVRLPVDDMLILELGSRGMLLREIGDEVGMSKDGVRSRLDVHFEAGYDDPMPSRKLSGRSVPGGAASDREVRQGPTSRQS